MVLDSNPKIRVVERFSLQETPQRGAVERFSLQETPEEGVVERFSLEETPQRGAVERFSLRETPEEGVVERDSLYRRPPRGVVVDIILIRHYGKLPRWGCSDHICLFTWTDVVAFGRFANQLFGSNAFWFARIQRKHPPNTVARQAQQTMGPVG